MDPLVYSVGCIEFALFFAADFYLAQHLNTLKQDHPTIDACAPDDEANADDAEISAAAAAASAHARGGSGYDMSHDHSVPTGLPQGIAGLSEDPLTQGRTHIITNTMDMVRSAARNVSVTGQQVHTAVVAASLLAPIVFVLQMLGALQWGMFHTPAWLGYMTVLPGLGLAFLYAIRAVSVGNLQEVTKSQWLSVMWFRLDIVCVMATVMLIGWGAWLVAGMLYGVDLYLAQRLLVTERRLVAAVDGTQLIRDELDAHGHVVGVQVPVDHGATGSDLPAVRPKRGDYNVV